RTVEMNVIAYTNSCVLSVNEKITTVRTPATEIGTTIRAKAPSRLHPSIIAASSRSFGMALKNPIRSQVQNGIVNDGYTSTSDQSESCRPRSAIRRDIGMNRRVGGTR